MKTSAEALLERVLEEVATDTRRNQGGEARGSLLQHMVAEVQARTGTTVPMSLVEAWFDAVEDRIRENPEEASVDPWDSIDDRLDAERVV